MATTAPQSFQWPQLIGSTGQNWMTAQQADISRGFAPTASQNPTMEWMREAMKGMGTGGMAPAGGMRSPMTAGGPFGSSGSMFAGPSPYSIRTGTGGTTFTPNPAYGQYQQRLQQIGNPTPQPRTIYNEAERMLLNPDSFKNTSAYKFLFDQGTEAMNRTAAAKRTRFSGKSLLDAQQFGQGLASTQVGDWLRNLLSGASEERYRWGQEDASNRFFLPMRLAQLQQETQAQSFPQLPGTTIRSQWSL